jgi:hypothetical protein
MVFLLVTSYGCQLYGQGELKYTDDFKDAEKIFNEEGKLIYAIYTEDEELLEDYIEYIGWHDSIVALLNKEFSVYVKESDFNGVELMYNRSGILTTMALEEELDTVYSLLSKIVKQKEKVLTLIDVDKEISKNNSSIDRINLLTYLSCAKDVFDIPNESVLESFIRGLPMSAIGDSQYLDLVLFHTQTMGTGYSYIKQITNAGLIKDSLSRVKTGAAVKRIIFTTYEDWWMYENEELLKIIYNEFGWYCKQFEVQEWNKKYDYTLAKYHYSQMKKGDKTKLMGASQLFVERWILSQIGTDAPFMSAEDIGNDLLAIIDLLLDRKVDKSFLPIIEPWCEEILRIYPGFQTSEVYAELLKKMGKKDQAKLEKKKSKTFKSQLPKEYVKSKEQMLKDALQGVAIITGLMDTYFYDDYIF